jgi:alpha-D-ribose 1-methylphosphonate 5-triphosphate synthase subunit PhnL
MASKNVKLAVENVSKTFRVRGGQYSDDHLLPVLRRVSFDVYENEIVSRSIRSARRSACGLRTGRRRYRSDHRRQAAG